MTSQDWRETWEQYAQAERQRYDQWPVPKLLAEVRRGKFGDYYTIWYVIAAKATLAEAGWTLFAVLESDQPYLYRYHCAAALLKLLEINTYTPVQLASNGHGMAENLPRLRQMLATRADPPPG